MSLANQALLQNLGLEGFVIDDDQTAGGPTGAATVQAGATAMVGSVIRITRSVAGASVIAKSVLGGDACYIGLVINDSTNSINFFPFVGEFNNGVINQVLAIPAGQAAFINRLSNNIAGQNNTTPGWRSSVVP